MKLVGFTQTKNLKYDAPLRGHDLKHYGNISGGELVMDAPLRGHDLKLKKRRALQMVREMPPCGGMT